MQSAAFPETARTNTRTLVLTGASRGIGHATVKKFSASGWRVITVSRQPFSALCPWPGGEKNHVQDRKSTRLNSSHRT